MFQPRQENTPRTNNFVSSRTESLSIYVFGSSQDSQLQRTLLNTLDQHSYSYELQTDLTRMSELRHNRTNQQRLIIILSGVYSDLAIRQKIQTNNSEQQISQKVYIYTYPDKKSALGLKHLSSLKQVVSVCQQLKKQKQKHKHKSIRLAGVHSIDKSYSSSKNITKIRTGSHYQSIKYMRNNVYGLNENDLYDKITDIFEKQTSMEPFLDLNSAISNCKEPKDQKVLFIVPTSLNEQIVKFLKKKSKESFIDVMLVGPVNPNQYILSKNIVLATNSPRKVYEYLKQKNMISPHIVTFMFEELIRSGRYETERKIEDQRTLMAGDQASGRGYAHQQPVVTDFFNKITEPINEGSNDYEIGSQKKSENKPKIKKIKSPAKGRPSELKNSENDISIRVSEPHDQPIKQTEDYHTNKQGQKIRKSMEKRGDPISIASSPDIPYPPPAPTRHYPTAHNIRQQSNYHFPMKQNNYRHPSMIIHETSDEYRGSNKESVVNIEGDSKFAGQNNHSVDEIAEKRVIAISNGEPEAYYLHSDSSVKAQGESRTTFSNPGDKGINELNQGYQAQLQIFRKTEVSQPEEVRQQSTTSIRDTPNFKPIVRSGQASGYNYQVINQDSGQTNFGARSSTYHPYAIPQNNTYNISSSITSTSNYISPQRSSKNIVSQANSQSRQVQPVLPSNTYHLNNAETHMGSLDANIYTSPSKYNTVTSSNYQTYSSAYKPSENNQNYISSNNYTSIHKYVSNTNINGQPSSNSAAPASTTRNATSPRVQAKYNLEGYQRVEVNGITMYRKKQTQSNQVDRDSSPKVQRYEVSPRREVQIVRKQFTNRPQYKSSNISSSQNGTQRYVTSSYYNSSPKYEREYYNSNSYQVGPILVTTQEKINSADYRTHTSPQPTSKAQEQLSRGITYRVGGGQIKDKADVKRYEYYEQRLEAPNIPSSRTLNDSNWMSKPSDFYSDGSIMRKNNVRFGIKLKRKETSQASVIESKLGSRIYTVKDLNKKMALTKKIEGESQLQHEEEQYIHVNPGLTGFHYLIQEQLKYLECKLTPIFTYHDKIDYFSCIEDLVQKCQEPMDCGFILATEQQRIKLNQNLLPDDYYLIRIVERSPFLQLNQTYKIIQMDNFSRLPLAQKIVLDKKLFQYVVYRPGSKDIEAVADKFKDSQFIVQKCEVEMTWEFIDSYFEEYPQLTRVYFICQPEDVQNIKDAVSSYKQLNSDFQIPSLRLICINNSASNRSKLLQAYPFLAFLQSWQELGYKSIISQVHQRDKQSTLLIKPDRLYLHQSQSQLMKDIERQFPNRFEFYMYKNGSELPRKMLKRKERGYSNYLVMHESLVGEKISLQSYQRVFLMGRAKTIPNQVVRVIKNEELIQLLKD